MTKTSTLGGRLLRVVLPIIALAFTASSYAQMATGKAKFVGNVISTSVPSNFSTYWNQVTPENGGKWGTVEATRNVMNWSQMDTAYNYAQSHGYKFKGHNLIWGSQAPGWLTSLSQADQRAEIEQWIAAYAQRYPNMWAIDVVNEPIKTPIAFKNALGGDGTTGWDWVITAFQLARQYMPPTVKLLINEYGTEADANARNQYITIINLLKARGLIDGIGVQAHQFNLDGMSAAQMTTCLNAYQATGLDIYISELDIVGGGSDSGQLAKYQELFPVMWNHPVVKGITLWGYIVGQTWKSGTGLVNSNGTERPAMTWLKNYVASSGGTVAVTGVSVAPSSASIGLGGTTTLTATVTPGNATNKTVTWSSSNTSVATVNASGVVSGMAGGSATITATTQDGGFTAASAITVTSTPVSVTGVSVTPNPTSVIVGSSMTMTATVAPANATNKTVTWSSSNTSVATVNASGVVSGVAAGSATIKVTTQDGGFTATSAITVTVSTGSGVWLEPERGTAGSLWNVATDATASNGQYVTVKPGNNSTAAAPSSATGLVAIPFTLTTTGTWNLWLRTICPDANGDSFWIRIDSGLWRSWNSITASSSWRWDKFATAYNLGPGSHTLYIGYREDGAQLDKVYLTSGSDTPSGTGGTASN